MNKICNRHGLTRHRERSGRKSSYECVKCSSERVDKYRHNNMEKAYQSKGGKCERCGYDKCKSALEFHHRVPEDKSFEINKSQTISWGRIKGELEKCDLLCANCHREVHEELNNLIWN